MSSPVMYWVGFDTHPELDRDHDLMSEFNRYYNETHTREVVASYDGFIRMSRYELCCPDSRGDRGPRWLAVYEVQDEPSADTYLARIAGPPEGRAKYTPWPPIWKQGKTNRWRMFWRRTGEVGEAAGLPHSICVAGMDPPSGIRSEAEREEFDTFYNAVCLPAIMETNHFSICARYELIRGLLPASGLPRYCTFCEADEETARSLEEECAKTGTIALESVKSQAGSQHGHENESAWHLVYRRIEI